jgi:AcrR family transcriptional regulator
MGSQQRGEQTRARIVEAALACFAQQGYDAAGVAEICRRAGVSKGAFYHHFPSKQAVFLELMSRWLGGLDRQLLAVRAGAEDVPEGLLKMAEMAGQVFEAASGQLPLFLEFWSKAARDPEVWQATIEPYRRYQDFFADMVEAGIAEGSLESVDPGTAARALVSLAVGLVLQSLIDPQDTDWEQVTKDSMRIFLEGLLRR